MTSIILEERTRRSMSQKRLAHEAGIDPRTLRKIEKGEQVSLESFRAVCRVLGISPETLSHEDTASTEDVGCEPRLESSPVAAFFGLLGVICVMCLVITMLWVYMAQIGPAGIVRLSLEGPCRPTVDQETKASLARLFPEATFLNVRYDSAIDECTVAAPFLTDKDKLAKDYMLQVLRNAGYRGSVYRDEGKFW